MAVLALMVDGVAVNKFDLPAGETTLGRNVSNTIHIDDLAVSGEHARIRVQPDPYLDGTLQYQLEDLGSTNATRVNGIKIAAPALLKDGDLIQVAYNEFKFINDLNPDLASTAVILPQN